MAGPTGGADAPDLAGADKVNLGFIALIVAVATIGGFMFGYDSGVVNGTQKGLEGAFSLDEAGLGVDGVRVCCIVPGNVKTPRQMKWYTPEGEAEIVAAQCLKGRLEPRDVAALAMFLASDDARLITGHEFFVDAGWR